MTYGRPPPKYEEVQDRLDEVDTDALWPLKRWHLESEDFRVVDEERGIYAGPHGRLHHRRRHFDGSDGSDP